MSQKKRKKKTTNKIVKEHRKQELKLKPYHCKNTLVIKPKPQIYKTDHVPLDNITVTFPMPSKNQQKKNQVNICLHQNKQNTTMA